MHNGMTKNYWPERFGIVPEWDKLIDEFNAKVAENNLQT